MKKVTVITFPEYESLVLGSLGAAGVTQLKEVTGPDFDEFRKEATGPDYKALYGEVEPRYKEFLRLVAFKIDEKTPSLEVLRDYARNPEAMTKSTVKELDRILSTLRSVNEAQSGEAEKIEKEIDEKISKGSAIFHEKRRSLSEENARWNVRMETLKALGQDDVLGSLCYGVVNSEYLKRLEQHLAGKTDVTIKATPVSPSENLLIIKGPQESRKWVSDLCLVFEVADLSIILGKDVKVIVDPTKRAGVAEKIGADYAAWVGDLKAHGSSFEEKLAAMDADHQAAIKLLENEKAEKLASSSKQWSERASRADAEIKEKEMAALSEITFSCNLLQLASDARAPVMRTKVYSIMQGWLPDTGIGAFEAAIADVEKVTNEKIIVQVEDVSHEDKGVPTPPPQMKPSLLQPTWNLTTLRGWPTPFELNPAYISLFIFSLQFGFMFGDMGQGAVFLILGLILAKKFKRGLPRALGSLFIPMGMSAIIFGFLYGSVFLIEVAAPPAWLAAEAVHEAAGGVKFELYTALLPNPASTNGTLPLMEIIVKLAVFELLLGIGLGMLNNIKKGHYFALIGEHGLGMVLYVFAIYFAIGPGFTPSIGPLTVNLMLAGLVLSFVEPIIHGIASHHFNPMESISEGVGGLMMTFVEGLGNMFSFLRVAAFAVAHASLAVAATALGATMGPAVGIVIMNVIAMTFELISSSVQSMRLLYYEFMGKFFDGQGVPFKPFRIPAARRPKVANN